MVTSLTNADSATTADADYLFSTLQIKTILDLRTATEHDRRSARTSTWPQLAEATKPTIHEIPFLSSKFNHKLLLSLTWYNLIYFLFLLAIRRRYQAIGIITTTVMQPMGLAGVARRCLLYCGLEIRDIFNHVITDEGVLLVHCTQGKDRTGLTFLLIMMLALEDIDSDKSVGAIEHDYMLSNDGLKEIRGEMLDEMRTMGFADDSGFADAPMVWVGEVLSFLNKNWGGVRGYLKSIGLAAEELERVKMMTLQIPPPAAAAAVT